jgi:tellurite resistance protein TerC
MPAPVNITVLHWAGFVVIILVLVALDAGFFHRRARVIRFKEALVWTALWVVLAMIFAGVLALFRPRHEAVQFVTGYFLELSLSVDNVFVMVLVFSYFRISPEYQRRILIWGVLGALVMRGLMIWLGVQLIDRFDWLLYVFGVFIVVSGVRMYTQKSGGSDLEKSLVVRIARKLLPISPDFDGPKFFTRVNGEWMLTPLMLVLLVVEATDLLFAVDSIPAVFGVTRVAFIVFTSNVFAIVGLRSLYFLLAGALGLFRYLRAGISAVLVFIGVKMLIDPHDRPPRWFQWDMPDSLALVCVLAIILAAILASVAATAREKRAVAAGKQP